MLIRHSPDLVSLTFGVLFAAIGILLIFGQLDGIRLDWLSRSSPSSSACC